MFSGYHELDAYTDVSNLDWTTTPTSGIISSGCRPCHDRHYSIETSSDSDTISLTIEPRTPGTYSCIFATIIPIFLPILLIKMTSGVNAKKLIFWKGDDNTMNFTMRSKTAFNEEVPVNLCGVTSIWANARSSEDTTQLIDITIQHQDGMHAISIEADHKLALFISSVQDLLIRIGDQDNYVSKY